MVKYWETSYLSLSLSPSVCLYVWRSGVANGRHLSCPCLLWKWSPSPSLWREKQSLWWVRKMYILCDDLYLIRWHICIYRSTVANTVARFIVKSLPLVPSATPPSHVLGAWLFICRQLYNTGEGLVVLEPFQLHLHIARAHKTVS